MATSQKQALIDIYKKMPTPDIESRLQRGELTMLARLAAETELEDRKSHPLTEPKPEQVVAEDKDDARTPKQVALTIIGGSLVIGATAYWIMSSEIFLLIAFSLLIGDAMVLGKSLPRLGMTVGVLLTASPVLLGTYLWRTGELAWKGGDYRPLGTLISWGLLIFISMLAISLGSALIRGARHKGSWAQLEADIHAERDNAMQDIRKLD